MERLVRLIVNMNEGAKKTVYRALVNTVEKTIKFVRLEERKIILGNGQIKDIEELSNKQDDGRLEFEYDFTYGICADKKQMIFDILENPKNKTRKTITVVKAKKSLEKHAQETKERYNKDRLERIELVKSLEVKEENKTLANNILSIMESRKEEYPHEIIELCMKKIKEIESLRNKRLKHNEKMVKINKQKENGEMIRNIRQGKKLEVLQNMVGFLNGQTVFGSYKISNEIEIKEELNVKDLSIPTITYLNNMLELDEFSVKVNNIIHKNGEYPHYIMKRLEQQEYNIELVGSYNTYNNEVDLENNLQYTLFTCEDNYGLKDYYILLEVHCGGDIRTGYSPMVCFKIVDLDYFYNGMRITGYISSEDIEMDSYDITEECTFKNGNWWYDDTLVTLHTTALGF